MEWDWSRITWGPSVWGALRGYVRVCTGMPGRAIKDIRYKRLILKSDIEPAILKLKDDA